MAGFSQPDIAWTIGMPVGTKAFSAVAKGQHRAIVVVACA